MNGFKNICEYLLLDNHDFLIYISSYNEMEFAMMVENTKIFKALSDNSRLRILKMLQIKSLCVCEIQDILGLAASTVSKHLSILRDTGFITEEKVGKWVNYMINTHPKDLRISSVLSSLDFWIADEKLIIEDKDKMKSISRFTICSS